MDVLNLIGGSWLSAEDRLDCVNPTTGRTAFAAPRSGPQEVAAAVFAARNAFAGWASLPGPTRGDVLFRAAELVQERAAELTNAIVEDVGKPVAEARAETARTAVIFRYFAGHARSAAGSVIPSDARDMTLTLREPLGVVGLITPWNFPAAIPAWKLGPALVAGNTVVLKPAEQSPRIAALLARIMTDAGLPAGTLNVVHGDAAAGRALVEHPDVDAVSFTGSIVAGASVREACARRGVRVQVEMGGKNVAVVLADASMGRAAGAVAGGAFGFAGQKCTATGLCLVERSAYDEFLPQLEKATEAVVVGPPADGSVACGPLIDLDARRRAVELGAEPLDREGFFVRPHLLADARMDEPTTREELFVPVLPVMAVDGLDEALEVANSLETGLSAGLHTDRASAVREFMQRMRAGVLAVNRPTTGLEVQAPFGGLKTSGSEHKEQGAQAADFYTDLKTVYWSS